MDEILRAWHERDASGQFLFAPFIPLGELRFTAECGVDDRDWPSMRPELKEAILSGDVKKATELRNAT